MTVTHALPVPVIQESDLIPKRVIVLRLHGTGISFRTGMRISIRDTATGMNERYDS